MNDLMEIFNSSVLIKDKIHQRSVSLQTGNANTANISKDWTRRSMSSVVLQPSLPSFFQFFYFILFLLCTNYSFYSIRYPKPLNIFVPLVPNSSHLRFPPALDYRRHGIIFVREADFYSFCHISLNVTFHM